MPNLKDAEEQWREYQRDYMRQWRRKNAEGYGSITGNGVKGTRKNRRNTRSATGGGRQKRRKSQ